MEKIKSLPTNHQSEYGELMSRDGSSLLMKIHLNIENYQNLYRKMTKQILSYMNMDQLHFDDFYAYGFITPDRNKAHSVTRDSFVPVRIDHDLTNIEILASPIQVSDQEVKLLNSGFKFYVKPYFEVSRKYKAWSLDTITFNLSKGVQVNTKKRFIVHADAH